jgi:hypothetical protein
MLLVYFKVHETAARTVSLSRISTSLLEEVKDAISDIAEDEEDYQAPAVEPKRPAAPSTAIDVGPQMPPGRPPARRTAKRTPPTRTE